MSQHGFAINVLGGDALAPFAAITPCGIGGVRMTAVETESGQTIGVREFGDIVAAIFERELDALLPAR